jgi:hypothetical protein
MQINHCRRLRPAVAIRVVAQKVHLNVAPQWVTMARTAPIVIHQQNSVVQPGFRLKPLDTTSRTN